MLDDEINKRIREAADQYHPGYNEQAWSKMEQMLDEHLPQKKDRRRIFFYFLFAAVLLCGGVYSVYYRNDKKEISGNASTSVSGNVERADKKTNPAVNNNGITGITARNKPVSLQAQTDLSAFAVKRQKKTNVIFVVADNSNAKSTENRSNNDFKADENVVSGHLQREDTSISNNNKNQAETSQLLSLKNTQTASGDNLNDSSKTHTSKTLFTRNSKSKVNAKSQNELLKRFGITFSAGPDISGVDVAEAGKVTLSYGAGLRYLLSDRISLRSGFYVSKKIYSAEKKYYKPSAFTYADYYYLQSVDANCNVYEIPITVSYSFNKSKNHNWFVSTGVSSYLMKKESYQYYYKYPSGITSDKSWALYNKNKHYFSVLDISGGYEYHASKKLTLSAEPYLKLPLTGIGDGKIKLKSSGVLFSVTLHP